MTKFKSLSKDLVDYGFDPEREILNFKKNIVNNQYEGHNVIDYEKHLKRV